MGNEADTIGESLFEAYLILQGYTDFIHEQECEGKSKKPDYTVHINNEDYLFEVKDFVQTKPFPTMGSFDDYTPIRSKINEAQRQFKPYKNDGRPCSVVLHNVNVPLLDLHSPDIVFGAMEGNFGIIMPINVETGRANESAMHHAFLDGDKMIRPKTTEPQNTTVSALITLRYVHVGSVRYRKYYRDGNNLPATQRAQYLKDVGFDTEEKHLGVIIWENRLARNPLPSHVFRGAWDERFIYDATQISRVYEGAGILECESLEPGDEEL